MDTMVAAITIDKIKNFVMVKEKKTRVWLSIKEVE